MIADEGLLQLVLENLLINSWKYTSKVPEAEIEFGYTEEQTGTAYFVRDNGVGFDPRYADRLSTPSSACIPIMSSRNRGRSGDSIQNYQPPRGKDLGHGGRRSGSDILLHSPR